MKTSVLKLSLLTLSVLAIVACGKKKSDEPVRVGAGAAAVTNYTPGSSNLPTNQNMVPLAAAQVIAPAGANLTDLVKILMAPVVPEAEIGTVDSVIIGGDVSVDRASGRAIINPQQGIRIQISDSNVGQPGSNGPIQPMNIVMSQVSGGISNGNVALTYRDRTGEIRITGTYDANTFNGVVSFVNDQANAQGQREGTLGSFQVRTCGFFRCN